MVSALVLNWNELEVVKDSVRRLLKECDEVIVVDNGSTDGSKEYFHKKAGTVLIPDQQLKFTAGNQKLTFIDWPENVGSSVGRNLGLAIAKGDYMFLIDGDILYVPGTIAEYIKILEAYPDAACVGQNSLQNVAKYGHNGTTSPLEADIRFDEDYTISDWFPMAWTQYGLFRGDLLREIRFVTEPPFDGPGHGYEDDWLYHEFKDRDLVSLATDKPLYYHMAHTGLSELQKAGLSDMGAERQKVSQKRWGKNSGWRETLSRTEIQQTTRPKPD